MRPGIWFVLAIAIGVLITNLGAARLWDRDEPRNAQCAREMLDSGNWIVPTFDGQLRTHKPILIYWCQIAAYKTFGVNEFSARFPSAVAALLTVLCTFSIARRLSSETGAIWSAVALSTMILFVMAGRAATPDALLIATSTLAIALFVNFAFVRTDSAEQAEHLSFQDGSLPKIQFQLPFFVQWTIVYAACGLAVLAKGPVGIVLPVAVMGLTILLCGSGNQVPIPQGFNLPNGSRFSFLRKALQTVVQTVAATVMIGWKMRPFLAIGVTLLIAGPWYLAVGLATDGQWLREFFLTHNVSRAVKPMEGHTGPPVLFYVGALLVGTFPWSCFAIPIGLMAWRRVQETRRSNRSIDPLIALATAWVIVYVGCFSIASTKLPSYVTPCHPGIALLVGWYVARAIAGQVDHPRWMRAGLTVAFVIGVGIFIAIGGPLAKQLPAVQPLGIAGAVFAVAGLLGVALAVRSHTGLAMRTFVIGAVCIVWMLHGLGPALVDRGRTELDALQAAFKAAPDRQWWIEGSPEPSWVFYSNGRIRTGSPTLEELSSNDAGKIEMVTSPTIKDAKVFLEDQYLRITDLAPARIAERP